MLTFSHGYCESGVVSAPFSIRTVTAFGGEMPSNDGKLSGDGKSGNSSYSRSRPLPAVDS